MLNALIMIALITVGLMLARWLEKRLSRPTPGKTKDQLDTPLLQWSPADVFTVRDLLNGGVCITGRAGSGKTSSSGKLKLIFRTP